MVLYRSPEGWRVRIKTQVEKLDLPLSAEELDMAVAEAEQLYADARALTRGKPLCFQCAHWMSLRAECGLGFPEGRSSGGKFAQDCCAFWGN